VSLCFTSFLHDPSPELSEAVATPAEPLPELATTVATIPELSPELSTTVATFPEPSPELATMVATLAEPPFGLSNELERERIKAYAGNQLTIQFEIHPTSIRFFVFSKKYYLCPRTNKYPNEKNLFNYLHVIMLVLSGRSAELYGKRLHNR
jgi:hypothetical protein